MTDRSIFESGSMEVTVMYGDDFDFTDKQVLRREPLYYRPTVGGIIEYVNMMAEEFNDFATWLHEKNQNSAVLAVEVLLPGGTGWFNMHLVPNKVYQKGSHLIRFGEKGKLEPVNLPPTEGWEITDWGFSEAVNMAEQIALTEAYNQFNRTGV